MNPAVPSSHNDFFRSFLESPKGIVIFTLDLDYRYTSFSGTHKKLMNTLWGVDIKLGMNVLEAIPHDGDRIKAKANFDRAIKGEYFACIEEYSDAANERTFYNDRYGPVKDQEGNVIGLSVFVIDISELKRKENELKESENRLGYVLKIIPDLIFTIDQTGRCLDILSNKTPNEIGRPKIGNLAYDGLPKHVMDQYKNSIKSCLELQAIQTFEYALIKNDIAYLHEARFVPSKGNEILTLVRDITFEKKIEPELLKLSLIAKHTSNAVVITGADGRIEWVNEGFTRITEYSFDEVLGKKPGSILQGEESDPAVQRLMKEKILEKKPFNIEIVNYSKSGRKYWMHINGQPIFNEAGEVAKFFAIESDITERKLSEIRVLEQNTRLTSIAENLTRKNEQLEEFTQIVSHNLRSPIGNICALVEHLNSTQEETERLDIIEHLKQTSDLLMVTLQELNEVLKIKHAGHIDKDQIDLEKTFAKVKQMLLLQINEVDANVTANFIKAPILSYPSIYIESILLNLLSNSLKYSSRQRRPSIHFESWKEQESILMSVTDNGLGINLERHGHQVFKLRKTFHAHPESRGVGLFMIKNQIETMGGEINISSKVDVGTTFFIKFGTNANYGG